MDRTVHIYTDHGPISFLLVAVKGAMVLFGIFLLGRGFFGEMGEGFWIGLVLVAAGGFFGGYDLIKLLDRSPQLTFSPEGFVDHRAAAPAVIPWDQFASLGYRGGGQSMGWTLEIFLKDGGHVLVPASHLAVKPKELVRMVQEFAPGAEVERRFRLWLS